MREDVHAVLESAARMQKEKVESRRRERRRARAPAHEEADERHDFEPDDDPHRSLRRDAEGPEYARDVSEVREDLGEPRPGDRPLDGPVLPGECERGAQKRAKRTSPNAASAIRKAPSGTGEAGAVNQASRRRQATRIPRHLTSAPVEARRVEGALDGPGAPAELGHRREHVLSDVDLERRTGVRVFVQGAHGPGVGEQVSRIGVLREATRHRVQAHLHLAVRRPERPVAPAAFRVDEDTPDDEVPGDLRLEET